MVDRRPGRGGQWGVDPWWVNAQEALRARSAGEVPGQRRTVQGRNVPEGRVQRSDLAQGGTGSMPVRQVAGGGGGFQGPGGRDFRAARASTRGGGPRGEPPNQRRMAPPPADPMQAMSGWEHRAMQGQRGEDLWPMSRGAGGGMDQAGLPWPDWNPPDYSSQIAAGYDAQRDAILGALGPMREAAGTATGAIGDYFGFAAGQAEEGRDVVRDIYGNAQTAVGDIYDQHGEAIRAIPGEMTNIATAAAGQGVSPRVAEQSAIASAPFAAAGESARAAGLENLTRRSSAAQNYMQQLAAASPAEAGQRQSEVESQLAMASSRVQQQAAMVEAEKQRTLAQHAQDISTDLYDRQLDVLAFGALGFDPNEAQALAQLGGTGLSALGMMQDRQAQELAAQQGMGPQPMDSAEILRQLSIDEKTDPVAIGGRRGAEMIIGGSSPATQQLFNEITSAVQQQPLRDAAGGPRSDQEFLADALNLIATYTDPSEVGEDLRQEQGVPFMAADRRALEQAFRAMYGG